jgi:hypothetical protein
MVMYILMSFFPNLHPWNILAGFTGGSLYFVWSIRVRNRPQIITNLVGITVCLAGLVRAFG